MQQSYPTMASESNTPYKQNASAFWKAYFAKFRRRVEDHGLSETGSASLSATPVTPLPFPDRRRSRAQRHSLLR